MLCAWATGGIKITSRAFKTPRLLGPTPAASERWVSTLVRSAGSEARQAWAGNSAHLGERGGSGLVATRSPVPLLPQLCNGGNNSPSTPQLLRGSEVSILQAGCWMSLAEDFTVILTCRPRPPGGRQGSAGPSPLCSIRYLATSS